MKENKPFKIGKILKPIKYKFVKVKDKIINMDQIIFLYQENDFISVATKDGGKIWNYFDKDEAVIEFKRISKLICGE